MPGRIRFYVGQIVVGAEILAIDTERSGPPRYQLRYACCGTELWDLAGRLRSAPSSH